MIDQSYSGPSSSERLHLGPLGPSSTASLNISRSEGTRDGPRKRRSGLCPVSGAGFREGNEEWRTSMSR